MKIYEIQARFIVKFNQDLSKLDACTEVGVELESPPLVADVQEVKVIKEHDTIATILPSSNR